MGAGSWYHWVIVGVIVLLLFGKGRFSGMMGDVAKGIKEFKKGMAEEDSKPAQLEDTSKTVESNKQADKTT